VIWVIGWCIIALALLAHLPLKAVAAFRVVVLARHHLIRRNPTLSATLMQISFSGLWKIVYVGFAAGPVAGVELWVLYSFVPWVGVIAAGYAFGAVLTLESGRRRRTCRAIGL